MSDTIKTIWREEAKQVLRQLVGSLFVSLQSHLVVYQLISASYDTLTKMASAIIVSGRGMWYNLLPPKTSVYICAFFVGGMTPLLVLLLLQLRGSVTLNATELRVMVEMNICGNWELCQSSTEYRRGIRCQCDPDCRKYGDCCRDSPLFRPQDVENKVCRIAYNATSRSAAFVSMVGSCPPEWQDPQVRQDCQRPKDFGDDPLASAIPMSDMSTLMPITYRNSYCAICNNANLSSLKIWKAKLHCSKVRSQTPTGEKSLLINTDKKWSVVSEGVSYPCSNLTPVLPPILDDVRRCPSRTLPIYYINKCSNSWKNITAVLCKSYTAYIFQNRRAYQNAYCAQCNSVNLNATKCQPLKEHVSVGTGFASFVSFQELLDFELQDHCAKYEVYDPFTNRCRRMFSRTSVKTNESDELMQKTWNRNGCPQFVVTNETYIFAPDNQSVWIPAHGKSYWKGEFLLSDDQQLAVCLQDGGVTGIVAVDRLLTYIGLGISIILLTLHLCAFASVAELRNLSGRTLASLCVALLSGYIFFVVGAGFLEPEDSPFCAFSAVAMYYSFLSAFTWMLVIGFDVWRALRQAVHFQSCRGRQWHRFFAYSAFAWLTPVIMTSLAIAADIAPEDLMAEELRPGFGVKRCWFSNSSSLMIFFGAPLALIMILNVGIFASAAWMTMGTRPCGMSTGASGARRDFRLYLRLAVMVGLTWVVGLLANVLNYSGLWSAFVVLNTLQGLFIFVMFTCTAKVFRGLQKAMPWTESFRYSVSNLREKRSTKTWTGVSNDTLQDSAVGSGSDREHNPEVSSLHPKKQNSLK